MYEKIIRHGVIKQILPVYGTHRMGREGDIRTVALQSVKEDKEHCLFGRYMRRQMQCWQNINLPLIHEKCRGQDFKRMVIPLNH